jgi:hypothetical protein
MDLNAVQNEVIGSRAPVGALFISTKGTATMVPNQTPARLALTDNRKRKQHAEQDFAEKAKHHDQARDQRERGEASSHEKDDALLAFDRRMQSWPPQILSPEEREERRRHEEDADHFRRALPIIQAHVEAARAPMEEAARAIAQIESEAAPLIDAVLAEEGHAALAALSAARADAVRLESLCRSIATALAQRQSYRAAETISVAVNTMRWPEAQSNPAPYLALAERLMTDPDAAVTP